MRKLVLDLRDARPAWAIPDWAVKEIRTALPSGWALACVEAQADGRGDGAARPSPEALAAVRGAEVYVGYGFPRELYLAAAEPPARLRWVHSAAAGVGGLLHPELRDSDIVVTNAAGVYGPAMAETVLAMLFHFARGLDHAVRAQAERRWDPAPWVGEAAAVGELAGATLGLVGFGGIGREVARRAAALGMRVIAAKRRAAEPPEGVELETGPEGLRRVLRASDHLVVCAPATEETRGLVGAAELALLRPGAVLVNVARGALVDEGALVAALRAGRLRGAALDVFATEPLPADSPLWGLPNVLVMPHVSGASPHHWKRATGLILENLRRYLDGRPLRNEVDKRAGY